MEQETPGSSDRKERGSALTKALTVMEAVFAQNRPVGLPDLTAELGLPRQTLHRVLVQLESSGLLQRDQSRDRFFVGPRMTRLALEALNASRHTGSTRVVLQALVDEIQETCNIGVLDGREVIYLDRVECDWPLRVQLQAGSRVPAHCTSIGKLLLAYLGRQIRHRMLTAAPLPTYTATTITNVETLEAELAQIRKQGFSVNDQEYSLGMVAVAVPIPDDKGRPIAALAVHAPVVRMSIEQGLGYLPKLRACAAKLSWAWGYGEDDGSAE